MSNLFINKEVRLLSSREQARLIRDEALSILNKVNEFSSTSRRVGKRAAYKVISRSLSKTDGLPFSIRKYQALSELSTYISLAKHNKVNGFKAFNTDLLPVSHPRSTKLTTMTASAMLEAQMRWVIDDPQITDDSVKSLIASAMMSHPDSPEHIYSMKRIELLPQGTVPLEALVAAYGDGNSRAARSARAKLQRRDRKGRFAEMFGTFKLILGLRDGGKASATGRILGQNIFSPDFLDMELPDGRIAAVPISQGEQPEAFLDDVSPEAREKGFVRASDADIDKNAPVVSEDSIVFMDAPSGFREDKEYKGTGKKYTDEAFDVTVFDGPSPITRDLIDDSIKRSREIGLEDPRQIKLGEDGKLWDPDRKLFAVNRRGEQTKFAFAQNWKDALEETRRKERIDEQEQFEQGEDEETSPLAEQLKGSPKKKSEKKEKAKLSEKGFSYNIPKGSLELDPDYNYVPEGTEDDPSMLAAMQSEDELQSSLVDALDPVSATKPATGLGRLEDENGEEFEVPAEAILSAIGEQGGDKEMALAKAYDTINNNSENEKALEANRKKTKKDKAAEPKKLDEIFDEVVSEEPEKPVAELPKTPEITEKDSVDETEEKIEDLGGIPALEGLSREEQEQIASTGDYRPFIPKNEDISFPEGMYKPNESKAEDREEALKLAEAKNLPDNSLIKGLEDAIKNGGKSDVLSFDENGELVPTPISAEAWRDAAALRGRDANKILKEIADGSLDLDKEKKEDDSKARKKQQAAAKEWQKRRNNLIKDLGIEKDSWNEQDVLKPIERAQNLFGDDPAYEQDINELIESYKSFLEGKDLNKYDDAEAGLRDFKEAVDGITEEDENYKKLVDAVSKAVDESLASIAEWRKRNPEAGGDEPKTEEEEALTPAGDVETQEAPSAKELLDEEEALADKFEQEGMTRSDAQGAASAETKRKYGKTSDEALAELPRAEAIKLLEDRLKEETPAEEPKKKSRKKKAELPPEGPTDGGGPTDEEPPKKIVKYKRVGKRTLLRDGKGVPFKTEKEVVDFLKENGFEFSKTVERDGKTFPVNAHTALQDDEEFKALARELRDRFGLDLQPQPATPNAPAQEPIDFDAPAPVKEEPAPTPEATPSPETPAPSKKERDIADLENELEMLERLIKQDDVKPDVKDKMAKRIEKVKKDLAELKEPSEEPTPTLTPTLEPDPVDLFENKLREEIENLEKEEISLSNKKDLDEESSKKLEQVKERLEFLSKVYKNFRDLKEKIETAKRVLYEKEVKLSPEQKQNAVDKLAKYSNDLDNLIRLFDEDTVDATVKDAIIDNVVNPENPSTVDGLLDKIKNKLKEKGEKRFGKPEEEGLFGSRKDMISRLMWFKWGAGAVKNESIYIQMAMKKYKKELEKLTDQELTDILNLYYDEMDARLAEQNEKTERNRKLAEARAKKRKEREDKLLEDSEEKPEETPTDEEAPVVAEEKPLPLSAKAKEILKALVDRRRKIQRKIDKADLDDTTTAAKRKALKDELDEVTKIIDEIVLGEKSAELVETPDTPATPEVTPEVKTIPASSLVKKMNVRSSELKPGDIIVGDHFVITDVKPEGTKKVKVEGVTQDVPAYRISGYFPGSVEQSSKLWSDDYAPEIYRGATPPPKGDLPELNQPKAEDYGAEYAFPNQKKVKYKDRTLYAPKNEELEKKFLEDYKAYDEERLRRKALWTAPEILSENNEEQSGSPVTPKNTLYTDNVAASEVQVGDIAFRRDKDGLKEFFVVTNVVGTKDGVTNLEGHYVGHQTQTKEWRSGTTIEVIRGETNLPASGDKEPLDRPDKTLPNYKELEQARKEKIAEADKGYAPNFPTSKAFQGITPLSTKPQLPAFYGSAEELLTLGDGPEIMKALDEAGYIVFDFETRGEDVTNVVNPDAPIQAAAVKYVGGKKVGELNLFINPGEPLGRYYYTKKDEKGNTVDYLDENGNRAMNPDRILKSGDQDVTDEWLATQPDIKEQLQKLVDFFGTDAILVGQNNSFDINVLERFAEKLGIDFKLSGSIDTLGIARALQKIELAAMTFPENPSEGDKVTSSEGNVWEFKDGKWKQSNQLADLAARLGIPATKEDKFHDALFDVEVTDKVLRALLSKMKAGNVSAGGSKSYNAKYNSWLESRKQREKDISEIEAAKIMSGKGSSIDEAVSKVKSATDDKVEVIDGEESIVTPKIHTSKIYGDQINEDWVKDPENTEFIPNARVEDLKLGDFIVGKNGNIQEVIAFADDEKDPANAIKVFRQDIEDGIILEDRASERPDGGTGFYLNGKLEGGIYRRISNINKTNTEIIDDAPKPEPVSETPVVVEPVEPVKGEELTEDQISTVAANVVDDITSGVKPEATIDEAVKGANVDETIKEQVLGADRVKISEHLTKEGIQLSKGDRVINNKNKKTGRIASFFKAYGKAGYSNYVKVKYDDGSKGPVASDSLSIIDAASDSYTPRIIKASDILRPATKSSTKTVQDVIETIKNIQSTPTPEGVDRPNNLPNPEELGKKWKDKEEERDKTAKELNFISIPTETVYTIKNNIPATISTQSFMPSLKTGEPMTVRFGFDKPTGRELSSYSTQMNISSPEDILVFKATSEYINRKEQIATIKPDGEIVWFGEKQKNASSIDLKNALDDFLNPIKGLQAMIIAPEMDDEEPLATVLGINDSGFDYDKISKFTPTFEQKAVIEAVMTGKNVVVRALAGTGKTSTLKLAARRLLEEKPDKNITYIVFNKAAQEESAKEFPKNTDVRTADSIGYNNVSSDIKEKFDRKKFIGNAPDIAKLLGVTPTLVNIKGTETTLGSREIPRILRDVIDKFTASDDDKIAVKHFAGLNLDTIPEQFVGWANKMWEDISSPTGQLYTSNSDLTKIWALSKPDLSKGIFGGISKSGVARKVDIVLYDEAQDINPVMAKVMREQTNIQSVFVGDSNQAIYGFRGAIDELDNITADYDLPITETFRFGEDIAGIANRFLTKLGSKYRVKGVKGKAGQILDEMDDPTVIITKTNGGGISAALEMLEKGKVVGIDEKTYNDYLALIKDIEYLKFADAGKSKRVRNPHKDLASFSTWNEVLEAKGRGESLGSAAYMVNILDKMNTTDVKDLLSRIVKISNRPAPKTPFIPLTMEDLKDSSSGKLGEYWAPGQRFPFKVEYTVEKDTIDIRNGSEYSRLLKEAGFESVKLQGKNKNGEDIEYYVLRKQSTNLSELLPLLNTIKRTASGYPSEKPVEVEIVTAHKSKGKQWKRVRIYSDFNGIDTDESGEEKLPPPDEIRLSYVAVTRAEEALELGSLAWILNVTSEEDGKPNITEIEEIMGMTVTPDPEPVTPEEAGNEVVKARKITDEKTLEVANRLIALIEKGVVPWTKGWSGGGFLPSNGKTKNSYQGTNVLALWAAMAENGWTDPRFLSFNQGKALGGFVRKGEKGTKILKPNLVTKEVKQPDGTLKKQGYVYFTEIVTFNVSQFENLTLPPLVKRDPVPVSEIEAQILESYKDHPEIIHKPQDRAYYSPLEDKIYLPLREQFDTPAGFVETFLHELGHSTGHISRLGKEGKRKDLQDNYGNHRASRGEEELIAEITVALIAAEFGVEINWDNAASYAQGWLKPLKDDPGMLIVAAKQAQDAVNWMLGIKPEDKNSIPESDTQAPEAGEGVGSEGKTGEQIAEDKPETPEVTPEPNVGEQGQTGEEIAKNIPKNIDTSIQPTKLRVTPDGEEYDLWNNVTYDRTSEEGQDNKNLEGQHGIFASRILANQPLIKDRNEVGKYISDILKKYGYGNKLFYLASGSVSDQMLGKDPMKNEGGGVEAGVGLANSDKFAEGDPLKDVTFPVFLVRKRGISKIALLHEIAHAMEGGWQTGEGGGHSQVWHQTFLALLRQEGFQKEANLLGFTIGDQKGDTGVITIP